MSLPPMLEPMVERDTAVYCILQTYRQADEAAMLTLTLTLTDEAAVLC